MSLITLPVVLDLVAKATVILAVTGLAASLLRRASAATRHFVWTLGIISALVAPALTVALPRWELPIVRIQTPAPIQISAPSAAAAPLHQRQAPALGRTDVETAAAPASQPVASATTPWTLPSWPMLAFIAWALGAVVILARLLIGLAAVQWMSRRSVEVTDAEWLDEARTLATDLGLRNVRFLRGATGTMPMAWGIFRSSVVVPADADSWPAHRVRVVLLHELAHVKRRDCLTHLVAQLACAAYWFNPLVWMAARHLRSERERACDDLVLAAGMRGSDYADELLDIARVMNAGRFPAVFAGASLAMARRSQLEGRLIAILDPSVARRGLTRARAVTACSVFAIILMTVASVQPWAEEGALTNGDQQVAERPIESHPGQAAADNRTNAANQDAIQGAIQGAVQGRVQGQIQGRTQAEIQSRVQSQVQGGIHGGIQGSVHGGVAGGVVGGVVSSVATAIANVVADGAAQVSQEVARELERERDQDKDTKSQGRAHDPRAVTALMEALKDTDKDVRETAMAALVQMRDPRMFEPLVQALKDTNADVREHAAFGLGQLRDNRAIEPLTAAIKDQSASVREQVVFALGQLHAVGAIDALTLALKDSADDVREQAAFALSQIRDRRAVDPLISALKDAKPDVREQAAFALGQLRDPKAVDALVIALKDADADVREQAAFALGQIGDARAIDGLTVALKDANADVRQQAAFALGQIR